MTQPRAVFSLILVLTLLSGCVGAPQRPFNTEGHSLEERESRLAAYSVWSASGRIAVDDGNEGGSGQFRWRRDADGFELLVRAPLGQGSWRLHQRDGQPAVLEASKLGEPVSGPDPAALIAEQVGWHVPVDPMTWWARALRAPGEAAEVSLNREGLPALIAQHDWRVEYNEYVEVGGLIMPRKLTATRDPYKVRVVVATWRLEPGNSANP